MPRKVFFSFHYDNDVWRANQVRNSWVTHGSYTDAGFIDKADFESIERQGEATVKRWIDTQLAGTSVTVILVGSDTANRFYVNYEIERSIGQINGLVAVMVHNQKDRNGYTSYRGTNPLDNHYIYFKDGSRRVASSFYKTYDYINDNGYHNLGSWVDEAARLSGK